MSKYLKKDTQNVLDSYCEYVETLKKNPSCIIGREQIVLDKLNQYNLELTKMVTKFKKLEKTYKSMTKEEKKEYIRLVKIARRETRAEMKKLKI